MNSGIIPRIIDTFSTPKAMPKSIGTFINRAKISTIANTAQIMSNTIVDFFITILFYTKRG